MIKVFIDGEYGTCGLTLKDKLKKFDNLEYINLKEIEKKDIEKRKKAINESDITFLCLPDIAAKEAVSLVESSKVVIIDASTAHRINEDWVYGFPELDFEKDIKSSNRISVPGCHASGFNAIVYPLVKSPLKSKLPNPIISYSLTGYSGGGKSMISEYGKTRGFIGSKPYALDLNHKHIPEIMKICDLKTKPIFQPIIAQVKQGMLVSVPIAYNYQEVYKVLSSFYKDSNTIDVKILENENEVSMTELNDSDNMNILVYGNSAQCIAVSQFDNLGKGAAGAAVQCFKLRFGIK